MTKPLWERALENRDALLSNPVYLEALARLPQRRRPGVYTSEGAVCKRCGLRHRPDDVERCKPPRDDWREINKKMLFDIAERERQRRRDR